MHDLPFNDDEFDLVFTSHVFEHSYDFTTVANQCQRVLKHSVYLSAAIPVDYEVGIVDRLDFGSYDNFVRHFPARPEMLICQPAVDSTSELRMILKFGDEEVISLAA